MACVDMCPKQAIHIEDSIKALNAFIDKGKCINCNLCHSICQWNNLPQKKRSLYKVQG